MGSTPVGGGLALRLSVSQLDNVLSVFPPHSNQAKGCAVCRAGPGFCAPISTDVVRPRASKWADPKERHPSPAREPGVGPDRSARLAGK